ncbi:hypothetical protein [Xylanibacter rodentium]|uniref:hypothetical protein n=1 Tax=Xylanibacter rodentium TaxID=2736289 RepID=UPI0025932065|nr:hypothetical protein [Xylanibacter rodentium]
MSLYNYPYPIRTIHHHLPHEYNDDIYKYGYKDAYKNIPWASTVAMFKTTSETCEIPRRQEQSVKVNAFLYIATLSHPSAAVSI